MDSGSTAWMLTSTALVPLMTPGPAFFYGGMTRAKSVLNMMMSSVSIAVVGMVRVVYGHSLTFTDGGALSSVIADRARFGAWVVFTVAWTTLVYSRASAVVEVRAHDGPGLLWRVGRALGACGPRVRAARVDTLGAEAVDVFYMVDGEGRPPDGPAVLAAIRAKVLAALRWPGGAAALAAVRTAAGPARNGRRDLARYPIR